jgi:hypothetical protein
MLAPPFPAKLPRTALFALTGTLAGLLAALTAGELVWYLFRPPPAPEQYTEPPPSSVPAAPQLVITAAPVTVYPGEKNTFGVRVARDRLDGPVTVRFDDPGGLTVAEITIPAGARSGKAEVVAAPDARPGAYTITATASATVPTSPRPIVATTVVPVTLAALPLGAPRLGVSASPRVQVYQKGKNTFAVRVMRADFDDPVEVTFGGLPDGLKIPLITVPPGKTEATAELAADASAKIGSARIQVIARASPKGVALSALAETSAEVLDPSRAPLDLVLALDCTGSMKKSVEGLVGSVPVLFEELNRARLDVRFGLVGFRDTTLGQPLELPRIGDDRMSPDPRLFAQVIRGLRLGGGGGEGESSLDAVAEAANFPLRENASRVVLLVTDGPPKRVDGTMKSVEMTVKHLTAKRINQLHVVALPEYRKRFEPLWEAAKGKYFDLKATTAANEFDKLVRELTKTIAEAIPPQPVPKAEPSATPPAAVLPEPEPVKAPPPPESPEPDDPRFAPPVLASPSAAERVVNPAPAPPTRGALRVAVWAFAVASVACFLLCLGQWTILPGEQPAIGPLATGYGGGTIIGLVAGAIGYVAFDATDVPLLARLGGACLFGLSVGLMVPLAERLFPAIAPAPLLLPQFDPPVRSLPLPPPAREPLPELDLPPVEAPVSSRTPLPELDLPPVEAYSNLPANSPLSPPAPVVPVHKPNITATMKPGEGCPGCGRHIPGDVGTRYCMLCDATF